MKITKEEIQKIKQQNKTRLERIMSDKDLLHKRAKEFYGKNWKIIYAYENHPLNEYPYTVKGGKKK